MSELLNFLIIFDHDLNELRSAEEFGSDIDRALDAYSAAENKSRGESSNIEIVLVAADSLDTIKKTHSNYFEFETVESGYFAGI